MLYAFVAATILIGVAELGDKTQLLAVVLSARYGVWRVAVGITGAIVLLNLLAALFGATIGALLPAVALVWVAGVAFVGFGVWAIFGGGDGEESADTPSRFGPVLTSGAAFFLAELGDKTQMMAVTIAADPQGAARLLGGISASIPGGVPPARSVGAFVGVWLGATLGMLLANAIAVVAGALLGHALPARLLARASGVLFVLFGVATVLAYYLQ